MPDARNRPARESMSARPSAHSAPAVRRRHDTHELSLETDPSAVAIARRWVRDRAHVAGATISSLDIAELLTSELVTNSLRYGPEDGAIVVRTRFDGESLCVTVTDEGTVSPAAQSPEAHETSGRGLMLVQAMAEAWGHGRDPRQRTLVWFTVPVAATLG
jgi:anti-sigma regulatory factor (Ser/Thr protein kinase)